MGQQVFVKGRIFDSEDPVLQTVLADLHDSPERPRCMCVEAGVDLYISRRPSGYCLARMPGTGSQHHPTCQDYEPNPGMSGRGMLMGEAIVERSPEVLEIHIGFALSRGTGRSIPRGEPSPPKDVPAPKQRMSLQAVMHMLYEYARFNRWYPSMAGMRSQGVLRKYLMEAAGHVMVRGEPLAKRLYVPESFNAERKEEIANRRREKLAFLHATDDADEHPFGFVIGEFKEVQDAAGERKVIVKHMPDAPLYMQGKAWQRVERVYRLRRPLGDAGSVLHSVAYGSLEATWHPGQRTSRCASATSQETAAFRHASWRQRRKKRPLSSLTGAHLMCRARSIEAQAVTAPRLSSLIRRIAAWNSTESISRFE